MLKSDKTMALLLFYLVIIFDYAGIDKNSKSEYKSEISNSNQNGTLYSDKLVKERKRIYEEQQNQIRLERRNQFERKTLPQPLKVVRKGQVIFVDTKLIERVRSDVKTMMNGIQISPHLNLQGQIDGFQFLKLQVGSIAHSLGFKEGDIIHQVDKYVISSMSTIYKAYRRLKKLSPDRIEVVFSDASKTTSKEIIKFFPADRLKEKYHD